MRICALVPAVVLVLAQAAYAQVNIESVVVGFTSATLPGTAGVFARTAACQAEFPNTRQCTSQEVLLSRRVPAGLTGTAWVQPIITASNNNYPFDVSGVYLTSPCGGAYAFMSVSASGTLSLEYCGEIRAVACCGLPVDPAQGDLDQDGSATVRDETIFRRMLAGLPILLNSSP